MNATIGSRRAGWMRIAARVFAGCILLFWGFMIVGHLFGTEGNATRPLVVQEYALLSAMVVSLMGLAIAFRNEVVGASVTLAAVLVEAIVNWRLLASPYAVIPLAACLFLAAAWLQRRGRLA